MQCTYMKTDNSQCQANAMKESSFCFTHNPDTQVEKHLAVIRGGENSRRFDINLPSIELQKPKDVASLLTDTINRVRKAELPPNIANTIGYLSGIVLKAFESDEMEDRLKIIEEKMEVRKYVK